MIFIAIDERIWEGKLQYDTNREAAKISVLSLGIWTSYRPKLLLLDQKGSKSQARFTSYLLEKAFDKEVKQKKENLRALIKTSRTF